MLHCQKKDNDYTAVPLKLNNNSTGISAYLRKIALKLKMRKVIEQKEDQLIIKTGSTFRNYSISFRVGQDFEEFTQGLDNRHVKVTKQKLFNFKNPSVTCFIPPRWHYLKCCVNSRCSPVSLQSLVTWQGNKLVCEQIGEKKNRGWAHWMEDDKLLLVRQWLTWHLDSSISFSSMQAFESYYSLCDFQDLYCEGEVCRQVFKKKANEWRR